MKMTRLSLVCASSLIVVVMLSGCNSSEPTASINAPEGGSMLAAASDSLIGDTSSVPGISDPAEISKLETKVRSAFAIKANSNREAILADGNSPLAARTNLRVIQSYDVTYGRMRVATWRCDVSGQFNSASCDVDPGYVRIGGGAFADYGGGNGAMLWASCPWGQNGWFAGSKDHKYATYHTLFVYVVGLKIDGFSEAQLQSQLTLAHYSTSESNRPGAVTALPAGYTLLSGGGYLENRSGQQCLLVLSVPNYLKSIYPNYSFGSGMRTRTGTEWKVNGKDHLYAGTAIAHSYAIGIRSQFADPLNPNIPFQISSEMYVKSVPNSLGSNASAVSPQTPSTGKLISGYGGSIAMDVYKERLLTRMGPELNSQGSITAIASTKDHGIADKSGTTWVTQLEIFKGAPTCPECI